MISGPIRKKCDTAYTAEDLAKLSAKGLRYELLLGKLFDMAPAGLQHGIYTNRLGNQVGAFIDDNDLGATTAAETGFTIQSGPDTVFAPDYAFIVKSRIPDPLPRGFAKLVPDLVIETRSPGDTVKEAWLKALAWLSAGVAVVWAIDPMEQTLTVYRRDEPSVTLERDDTLEEPALLPGFQYKLDRLFREPKVAAQE